MKNLLFRLLPLLLIFTCNTALYAQFTEPLKEERIAFKEGEEITMIASYVWGITTDVGTVTLKLTRNEAGNGLPEHFQVDGLIRTSKFFDTFFKVNDIYQSKFDTKTLRPFYFMRNVHENRYHITNEYHYRDDHQIDVRVVCNNGHIIDTLLPGTASTFDLPTLFYVARCLDVDNMKKGELVPVSFAIDEDIFNIYLRYDGKEKKKIRGMGTFNAIRISAQVVAGVVFDGKEELVIWVTDDANHLPLLIESPVVIGRVTGRLGSYKNIKYPLTSKIK